MGISVYKRSRKFVYSRCLLAMISHAVMINKFPDLSYEQSWGGCNYSINNESCKAIITFQKNICVGAIRNYGSHQISGENIFEQLTVDFPENVQNLLKDEALQYLLEDVEGKAISVVSSVFWCDDKNLYFSSVDSESKRNDIDQMLPYLTKFKKSLDHWVDYFEMDKHNKSLCLSLYRKKLGNFEKDIYLNKKQLQKIPPIEFYDEEESWQNAISNECIEALKEVGIYT